MNFNVADILYCEDTGEHLLLVKRKEMEHNDSGRIDLAWDMIDIVSGSKYWEWEYVLEGSGQYERIA